MKHEFEDTPKKRLARAIKNAKKVGEELDKAPAGAQALLPTTDRFPPVAAERQLFSSRIVHVERRPKDGKWGYRKGSSGKFHACANYEQAVGEGRAFAELERSELVIVEHGEVVARQEFWEGVREAARRADALPAWKQRRLGGHQPEPEETPRERRAKLAKRFSDEVATWSSKKLRDAHAQPEKVAEAEAREQGIDALLDTVKGSAPKSGPKCRCCSNPVLRDLVARYYERRDSGEDMPSLTWVHRQLIAERFGVSFGAVRGHALRCLKRKST